MASVTLDFGQVETRGCAVPCRLAYIGNSITCNRVCFLVCSNKAACLEVACSYARTRQTGAIVVPAAQKPASSSNAPRAVAANRPAGVRWRCGPRVWKRVHPQMTLASQPSEWRSTASCSLPCHLYLPLWNLPQRELMTFGGGVC